MSLKAIQFIMAAAAAESFIMGLLVISQLETLQSKRLLAQPFLVLWLYTLKPCLSLKDIARKSFHFQEGNRTPRFSIKARRRQIVSRGFFFSSCRAIYGDKCGFWNDTREPALVCKEIFQGNYFIILFETDPPQSPVF